MFGLAIDLYDVKAHLRLLLATQTRTWMGVVFVTAALFSIQYDEVLAPHVTRISDAWTSTAADLTRKLASFAP
jgi:hypothetical protein